MGKHPPKPLTAETLQAYQEALLKAEPWRKLPEPWRSLCENAQDMRLAKERIYMAMFPEFSRDLETAGGRESEGGKAVFQEADQDWERLTGLPILCNGMAWYDAAVHSGYRPPEADKITLDDAERAVRAWAVGLVAQRRRHEALASAVMPAAAGAKVRQDTTAPGPTPVSDPQTARKLQSKRKLAIAMMLIQEHPDWSDRSIAEKSGYKTHSTLVRNKTYQAAAAMARGKKGDLPHGNKDGKTGNFSHRATPRGQRWAGHPAMPAPPLIHTTSRASTRHTSAKERKPQNSHDPTFPICEEAGKQMKSMMEGMSKLKTGVPPAAKTTP
jgi:hypothetical protein